MTMNTTGTETLARKLKASRTLAGFDQQQIADALGVGRSTVSGWERGLAEPPASMFVTWAVLTGQSLDWLAEGLARPKGLEPLTFWLVPTGGADGFWSEDRVADLLAIECQAYLDEVSHVSGDVS